MTVQLCIPYGGDDPFRARALDHVIAYLARTLPEALLHVGGECVPFTRGRALNELAESAADDDVLVFHDADLIAPQVSLVTAVALIAEGVVHTQVLPYTRYVPFTKHGTRQYLDGTPPEQCEDGGVGLASTGGVQVIRARDFRAVQGFEPRFCGWGWEDTAFRNTVDALLAPTIRLSGTLYHLFHPSAVDPGSPDYQAGYELAVRYDEAAANPDAIRALIAERDA